MENNVRSLSPSNLWNHFADLNAVPRPSKKEQRVIAFAKEFGEKLGLPTLVDEVGNVIIKKPATPGMENRVTVCLQSHLDMVHQKNNDTKFDFDLEGIRMFVDGDWVKAEGTTLGADNGIGVATIMALLSSKDIPHPPLEALFTIDEETGMTGAMGLKGGLLDAKIMLNLDTEEDNELTIGCAGGLDVTIQGSYHEAQTTKGNIALKLTVKGLTGGHSGMDIHLGRGNANKIMNRILWEGVQKHAWQVASIEGGGLRNAIPRESVAVVTVDGDQQEASLASIQQLRSVLKKEYQTTDANLEILVEQTETPSMVASQEFLSAFLRRIYACPNGIYRMSPDIQGLVQSSNNLARVQMVGGKFTALCLTRSSVESEKWDVANAIHGAFDLNGAEIKFSGSYPGWTPNPNSSIVSLMSSLYQERFGETAHVNACHAGLECGILGANYPDMEMISFGPNIRGAHSPDEKVQISSVQKFWGYLLETLSRIPEVR
jgi:dipeptidase D